MERTDDSELSLVQRDTPPSVPRDERIHSWLFGSYPPVVLQRPAPIVRFIGTVLVQVLLNLVLYDLLVLVPAAVTIGACTLLALVLAARAYSGWVGRAATGWKVAMFAALALNVLWVVFLKLARMA